MNDGEDNTILINSQKSKSGMEFTIDYLKQKDYADWL